MAISPEELADKLPVIPGQAILVRDFVDSVREYNPRKRFPTAKYDLHEILSAWHALVKSGKITTHYMIVGVIGRRTE